MIKSKILLLLLITYLTGCAYLHHVQVGEVVSHPNYVSKPFEIKLSEAGVDIGEIAGTSKIFMQNDRQKQAADNIAAVLGLFQMGPRTGNPVYVKGYANNLIQVLYEKCPSGRITGLMSVRETRKYPIVSGEIVKVTGYCMLKKGS